MPTRKELLFKAGQKTRSVDTIPATVQFKHNKKKGLVEPLDAEGKMLCGLRKALTVMSDKDPDGKRYFLPAGERVQLTQRPLTTAAKKGERQTYRAAGRCLIRAVHPEGHSSSMMVQFAITYRDVVDEIGLSDVEYIEPTTIDMIPRSTQISA